MAVCCKWAFDPGGVQQITKTRCAELRMIASFKQKYDDNPDMKLSTVGSEIGVYFEINFLHIAPTRALQRSSLVVGEKTVTYNRVLHPQHMHSKLVRTVRNRF